MLQQLDSEMTAVSERLRVSQLELQRLAAERAEQEGILCARQSEIEVLELQRIQLEQQIAAAQESLHGSAPAPRRISPDGLAACRPRGHAGRTSPLGRSRPATHRVPILRDGRARPRASLAKSNLPPPKGWQREAENGQLAQTADDLGAERNAAQAREGLLQFENEQLRARLTEIDELLRNSRLLASIRLATVRRIVRRRRQTRIRRAIHVRDLHQ